MAPCKHLAWKKLRAAPPDIWLRSRHTHTHTRHEHAPLFPRGLCQAQPAGFLRATRPMGLCLGLRIHLEGRIPFRGGWFGENRRAPPFWGSALVGRFFESHRTTTRFGGRNLKVGEPPTSPELGLPSRYCVRRRSGVCVGPGTSLTRKETKRRAGGFRLARSGPGRAESDAPQAWMALVCITNA